MQGSSRLHHDSSSAGRIRGVFDDFRRVETVAEDVRDLAGTYRDLTKRLSTLLKDSRLF